jgi:fumarate reductase flavoprotein subunit
MADWDIETDLVVVGAGACGLMAAFAAARRGVELILLEKDTRLGCNTELASGSIAAAGTRFQRAAGIAGTAEQMAEDVMRKNHGRADRDIVLALCRKAREVVDLIVDEVGLPLSLNTDAGRPGQSFLRMHNPPGRSGAPLVRAMHEALGRFPNYTFADQTPGAGLITDPRGAVIGVTCGADGEQRIGAQKVILACDGFGANKEMLRQYIPAMAEAEYIGAQGNTGDGIRWGMALGAALEHMSGHQGHGLVCPGYGTRLSPDIAVLGGIIVNFDGERFTREDQGYSELAHVILQQPRGLAVEIFDQRIYDKLSSTAHFKDTIDAGALRSGDTIEDIAAALKINARNLRISIQGSTLRPRYYGAQITGGLAHTQGGLKIDIHGRVLRTDGSIIPNLYAGGGTAAGISGDSADGYLSGNGLLSALSMGLIAGEHAAAAIESRERA